LNALLGWERAIVTDKPGTTRDTVEDEIEIGDILVRLIDTAGIRDGSADPVEGIGIERSDKAIKAADMVLFVVDGSKRETPGTAFFDIDQDKRIMVVNKIDLTGGGLPTKYDSKSEHEEIIGLSALHGTNIDKLREKLQGLAAEDSGLAEGNPMITRARQIDALKRSTESLRKAERSLLKNDPAEITALEFKEAAGALEEMVGRSIGDDVLDLIFESFCIGK
jgi:tRNA modification GTPase